MITEQHLHLALEAYDHAEEGSILADLAGEAIMMYAAQQLDQEKGEFTEDELIDETQGLILQHTLNGMIHKGLIEADIEDDDIVYSLTEDGKKIADALKDETL